MAEVDEASRAIEETQVGPGRALFPAEVFLRSETYRAEILVRFLGPGELLERPSMKDFIRLADHTGRLVASADDVRALNDNAAVVANILGNTYPFCELLTFYPESQEQIGRFNGWLRGSGVLGEVNEMLESDQAGLTMPDGFYYEYGGPSWRRRPVFWGPVRVREGLPYREDMQFSIVRRPDYRVEAAFVMEYMAGDSQERAVSFAEALERYLGLMVQLSPIVK